MTIRTVVTSVAILLASIAIGFAGLNGTAYLFDSMNWCCFHSWALLHGTGAVVFLLWAYVGFHIVKLLMKARGQFSPVPNLAFVCSALGTYYETDFLMWAGLVLCGYGVYKHFRHGDKAAAGLMWSAVFVSVLNFAYWLKLAIMFASF